MELMRLSIRQTYAQIGVETQPSSLEIHSPHGELSIEQSPAIMEIESPRGDLMVDSSRAWDALGVGSNLRFMNFIYSQTDGIFKQALAKMVEDGNRMADITNPRNAFAELAGDALTRSFSPIMYTTEASVLNVKLDYQANHPIINVEPQKARIEYTPHQPEMQYTKGNVNVYVRQQNSLQMEVSRYDLYQ